MSQTGLKLVTMTFKIKFALKHKNKFCVIPCKFNNLNRRNFTFKLKLCIDHIKALHYFKACDLDLQGQIGLQTCEKKIDLFGIFPLHLNCSSII